MDEEEWIPENTDLSDSYSLVNNDLQNLDEDDLQKLADDIGIRYQPPKPKTISRCQEPKTRPRRQRSKSKRYVPEEKIRDRRRTKYNKTILPSKRKANSFGGSNTIKQRAVFGNKFVQNVHRPLDVYKGGRSGVGY